MSIGSQKGNNQDSISEKNRSLVIKLIQQNECCSRAFLSKATGLKSATITYIVNDLMEWGIVREESELEQKNGRKARGLSINPDAFTILAIRINRKQCRVGLFNLAGGLLGEKCISTGDMTADSVMEGILHCCDEFIAQCDKLMVLGISLPGPLSKHEGRIIFMSGFPGWERINIREILITRYHLPVVLDHDANAGVLAEKWFGKHVRRVDGSVVAYISVGPGVGCGIIHHGNVFDGAYGMAGEIGHMSICFDGPQCGCGHHGCLEMYCSTSALRANIARGLSHFPNCPLTGDDSMEAILHALRAGDELANREFRKAARFLGIGVVNVINVYNPDLIIIGDELSLAGELLIDIVKDTVRESVLAEVYDKIHIELSSFKMDAGFHGACALALEYIVNHPYNFRSKAQELVGANIS